MTLVDFAQILLIVALTTLILGFFISYLFNLKLTSLREELHAKEQDQVLLEKLRDIMGSVDKNSDVLERQLQAQRETLQNQTKLIWERLEKASEIIGGVQQHLGGLQEFSRDMKDLSNVLKSPKLRGGLGEQFLNEILAAFLPADLFKIQYKFNDGSTCDAIIKTDKGLIPIDSKFSMENFKLMVTSDTPEARESAKKAFVKDVKKRIDEISTKYILPAEGTVDFAIMYVPSENVYYELIVNTPEIEEYARHKSVFMTSPNTLSYQAKILFVAFQQQELQKHAGDILKALAGVKVEAAKFEDELNVLDGHVDRTSKSIANVKIKYSRLFGKIQNMQAIEDADAADSPALPGQDAQRDLLDG